MFDKENILNILKNEKLSKEELVELTWLLNSEYYKERPVTIEEFCSSDDFVHKKWPNIFPLWKQTLNEIFPTPFNAPYNEILISAAAGAGKTVVATISTIYDMYKLGCLKDPCSYYGLTPDTMLIMAIFSATGATSSVNWNDLTTAIEASPWMMEKLVDKRGLEKKHGSIVPVEILPGIYIQTGSKFQHSMGKAIFDGLMDEAAFGGANLKDAQKTYNELTSRMKTRFSTYSEKGSIPGHFFLISSPKEAGDFMQYRIEKAKEAGTKYTKIMMNISSWDADPRNDSDDKFTVFIGNETKEPCIYEPEEENIPIEELDYLIYPPMRYYEEFKKDLLISIMNYGGITILSDMALFKSPTILNDLFLLNNPFSSDVIELPFAKNDKQLMDYMDFSYFKNIRHPDANRFIHIDAAYSSNTLDVYGLSAVYCIEEEDTILSNINKDTEVDASIYTKKDRKYFVDFCIGIAAKKGQEVPLYKIQDFITYLIKVLKYPVANISADQFQSKQTLQNLQVEGYETQNISVDKTRDPYIFLRNLVYNKQIMFVTNNYLKDELRRLRDDGKKVDHPVGCFTEDTKIKLVDGRSLSIKDLLLEQEYKTNYVYTFNETTQKIEPKPIKNVFQTKITKNLIKVTFDNGESVTCTPDHRFMLRDGSYEEIQHLMEGVSLMPLYTKISKRGLQGYRLFYEPIENKWHYEHRAFSQNNKGLVVHHCNFNKLDNTPNNLKIMTKAEHTRLHNNKTKDYLKVSQGVKAYHARTQGTDIYKQRSKKISKRVKAYNKKIFDSLPIEEQNKKLQKIKEQQDRIKLLEETFNINWEDLTTFARKSYINKLQDIIDPTYRQRCIAGLKEAHKQGKFKQVPEVHRRKCWITNGKENKYIDKTDIIPDGFYKGRTMSEETIKRMTEANRHVNWSEERKAAYSQKQRENTSNRMWITNGIIDKYINKTCPIPDGFVEGRCKVGKNHKIAKIEWIKKPCKVYDLEIQDNHNFALDAGVIVHNSHKDLADSVCGAVWNCASSTKTVNKAKVIGSILNPQQYSVDELESIEQIEFENLKKSIANGILKGL